MGKSATPNTRGVLCIGRSESKKGTVGEIDLVGTGDGECDTQHPGSPVYREIRVKEGDRGGSRTIGDGG